MQLTLLSSDQDILRVLCEGNISQREIDLDHDPLETLIGPEVFTRKILLNLERTHYVDSSGISWLMGRHKQFKQKGGALVLYAIPPMVKQVLQLLRMSLVLNLADDESAALALVQGVKS
jgi:anti-anti-sigma factor